ncbi:DUF790 family protein [Haliangium ochraceum]|uniref:DUF790 family protein n=1 Tax=Haliangium ochraceum (strain DSM 14365 / JCM 11303 / SMP-2) TaxID=502025 RepID=D0LUA1_HALO1|nr:DUF790 family protein [Haliangium ochraceum]ACY17465.1 protein of unknown function DUF790 [Haliangium ochraceum DSM 14365]
MLTADMVRAFRRGDELRLRALKPADRERATEMAATYIELTRACVGATRGEFDQALGAVPVSARDRKLAIGLRKLIADRCDFEVEEDCDPVALRQRVFSRAAELRRSLGEGERFERDAVLAEVAAERELDAATLERLLYVDLRSAHRLLGFRALSAEELMRVYELSQAQAVLLRAVRVRARVWNRDPGIYRALFHKLKFLRLLYRLEALPEGDGDGEGEESGGYLLDIDGPYSLFRSVTKYGLELALLLPAIQACEQWTIEAEVMWGKQRMPLSFAIAGKAERRRKRRGAAGKPKAGGKKRGAEGTASEPAAAEASAAEAPAESAAESQAEGEREALRPPDDVAALVARFAERDTPWRPRYASDILDLPGVGLCIPDLVFEHRDTGECVYFEVLGFWSREAVWRRVELVEAGLPHRILFAVSSRLRVSEAVLGDELPGALYVYKGVMSARAIEQRLARGAV